MTRLRKTRALVPLVVLALVASACGGDDDDAAAEDTAVDEPADEPAEEPADEPADEPAEEPAEEPADEPADEPAEEPADEPADEPAEELTPQRGGTLTFLLEAESDTWNIPSANCAVACITVMRQVMDPLTLTTDENEIVPFLLESIESNDDFTEWTLTMRDGVTFHDGTPADGAALQRNLIEMASGVLQGQVFWDLANGSLFSTPPGEPADSILLVDDMTVTVSFNAPVSSFGFALSERTGWLFSPSYWDNPERAGAVAVGTGPFIMTEWLRGEQTTLVANQNYWRTDANGEQLPYLDGINFRPVADDSTRLATLEAGDADAAHDDTGENLEFWRTEWTADGGQLLPPPPDKEAGYLMFNAGKPPFDNAELRRAVALCTDKTEYQVFRAPFNDIIDGPFSEGALGYMDDPGFPQFDPEAGNALLDQIGRPAEIVYGTTDTPSTKLTAELFADMWNKNCGLNVVIDTFDQSALITKALTGEFQVFAWRNHGQNYPALEYVWWHSRHTSGLALNFGRIVDPEIDALLDELRSTDDPAEIDTISQAINQEFAAEVYNLWLVATDWEIPYAANVHGVGVVTAPDGSAGEPTLAGRVWLGEAWKES